MSNCKRCHQNLPNYHSFNKNYYDRIILDSFIKPETSAELGGYLQIPEEDFGGLKIFLKKDGQMNIEFTNAYLKHLKKFHRINI